MQLKLFFLSSSNRHSLDKVVFSLSNQEPVITSKRGCGSSNHNSFKWSQAVRSLSVFFIEAQKNFFFEKIEESSLLSGLQGSPAASLDYAISKQPIWMSEMFGSDSRGRPILGKLIHRENTELKRPGPVSLYLSSLAKRELKLSIYLDDIQLSQKDQLEELSLHLDRVKNKNGISLESQKANSEFRQESFYSMCSLAKTNVKNIISNLITKDITKNCSSIEIFQSSKFTKYLDLVLNKNILVKEGLNPSALINQIHKNNNFCNLLGIVTEAEYEYLLTHLPKITVKTNIWNSSTNAILKYLQITKKLPIKIDYSELHSHAIYKNISENKDKNELPEIILLGLGGVLNLLRDQSDYELLLPSPSSSVDLLSSKTVTKSPKKNLPILVDIKERSTTGLFAMEEIQSGNPLIKSEVTEPTKGSYDEIYTMFKEGESFQTLLHYPHNEIAIKCNDAKSLFQGTLDSFFLIHKTISENKKLTHIFNAMIRDAWLTIREQPQLQQSLAQSILNEEDYVKRYQRLSGLYQMAV